MAKVKILNKQAFEEWEKEFLYEEPENFLFHLRIEDDEKKLAAHSIPEIHAHFVKEAIDYIEKKEYFDDYDDFIVSSRSYFKTNDGETLVYNVEISLEKEN